MHGAGDMTPPQVYPTHVITSSIREAVPIDSSSFE